jgi:hypothetical protein
MIIPPAAKFTLLSTFFMLRTWVPWKSIVNCAWFMGKNVMSNWTVRQWCRMFRDGWTDVHDEEQSGRPSEVSDDLVQSVDQKICERWWFTISDLVCEFSQISHTVLCKIITVRLGYHHKCIQNAENGFGFDFYRSISQRWQWISQSHHTSNRWWNLSFICECWN